jgi:hypothetical protein
MTSKKAKNRSDFRCEICKDGRISFISRLNQNDFLSFFFCHTFMQRSLKMKILFDSSSETQKPTYSLLFDSNSTLMNNLLKIKRFLFDSNSEINTNT